MPTQSISPSTHFSSEILPFRQFYLLYCSIDHVLVEWIEKIITLDPSVIILSNSIDHPAVKPLKSAHALLGGTLTHLIFDCRAGFPLDYFLSVSNAMSAGGRFTLMIDPNFVIDEESERFHMKPLIPHHFNQHLMKQLEQWAHRIDLDKYLYQFEKFNDKSTVKLGEIKRLTAAQIAIKEDYLANPAGISTLFAPRGSGKSYLAASIIAIDPESYILTAPNQTAIDQYRCYLDQYLFRAPDYLFLKMTPEALKDKRLIIEEAAKMPLAHLERLSSLFDSVLMVSSVENYEGTGQGLREKIYDLIPIERSFTLTDILRFNPHDPLAQFSEALIFNERSEVSTAEIIKKRDKPYSQLSQEEERCQYKLYDESSLSQLQSDYRSIKALYQLFNKTHYQTNIQDLRRLLDADQQIFVTATDQNRLIGAIWGLEEGNQTEALSLDVYRGLRRPKGNLVPQTLSTHSYYPEAMMMRSIRISRISVIEKKRLHGIATKMIKQLVDHYRDRRDYISVSFGLTAGLLNFWHRCGFHWIHLGTHQDKTTGLHAAIMIYPLSEKAIQWVAEATIKWKNDQYYLKDAPFIRSDNQELFSGSINGEFDARDADAIEAYREFRKPERAVYSALKREKKSNY